MASKIDTGFSVIKWPVALLALALLPGSAVAFWGVITGVYHHFGAMIPFLGGFAAYLAAWYFLLKHPLLGSAFSTLEHELTHALFAILTGHRVTGIKTSWSKGGEMTSVGGYNWLIYAGPYFFPTFSFLLMLLMILLPLGAVTRAVFGASIAYHMTSTLRETHMGQSDLQSIGYIFSLMFLPAANVISYGVLFAFALGGWTTVGQYWETLWNTTMRISGMG